MLELRLRLRRLLAGYKATMPLGMASIVLGTLGLAFVFMPVLGIPITGLGLLLGVLGLVVGLIVGGRLALRWSAGGLAIGGLAMAMNIAVSYAPAGYIPSRPPPVPWQPIPGRPEVPAPAALTLEESPLPPAVRNLPTRPAQGLSTQPPVAHRTESSTPVTRLPVPQALQSNHTSPGHLIRPPTIVLPPFAPTPMAPPTIPTSILWPQPK